MKTPSVVAEIGCNHKGDIEIAREMIGIAATFAKCDFVKFQKRSNRELLTSEEYNARHPNPQHSYGNSYGEHREFLEFDVDQHRLLQKWCEEFGIGYSTSVWDLTSAKEIAGLNPELIKIPSACNLHFPMLEYLAKNYSGEIHISLGMTTPAEQEQRNERNSRRRWKNVQEGVRRKADFGCASRTGMMIESAHGRMLGCEGVVSERRRYGRVRDERSETLSPRRNDGGRKHQGAPLMTRIGFVE